MSDWQERLSEAMEARGISGGELARRAGFTAQYINSMRSKERGGRLTLDTAQRLAQALGVSVEWLTAGTGRRERLSDVFPIYVEGAPESAMFTEQYASRAEAIALHGVKLAPEVIAALRAAVPPEPGVDPGRQYWIEHARELTIDHARINADPVFGGERASEAVPPTQGRVTKAPPSSHGTMERVPPTQGRVIKAPASTREHAGDGLPPATPRRKKAP